MPEISVVIRTKNEERWIGECLRRLCNQTYRGFEIVAVDSGSTDRTLDIVKRFRVRLLQIRPDQFSYPSALNYGCARAEAAKYFVFLSGHSLPASDAWLADGRSDFVNDRVMGAYGFVTALPDGTIWEKLIFNRPLHILRHGFHRRQIIRKPGRGVLGFTNAIIRRDLWEQHHFDESYGAGGEDGEWARYWLARGYVTVRDMNFSVRHSHGLGVRGLIRQKRYWTSLDAPRPFRFPEFRKGPRT